MVPGQGEGPAASPLALLGLRRFGPLFAAQFTGAFNDNLYKQALVVLVTFRLAPEHGAALSALAGAVFILPFLLFSVTAGRIADRSDMGRLVNILKAIEAVLMGLAAAALLMQALVPLFVVLFLLGVQATFFGPVKYAILPRHLRREELVTGNALVEGATFLAILAGSILGGVMTGSNTVLGWLAALMVAVGIVGAAAAWFVPGTTPAVPGLRIPLNSVRDTLEMVGVIRQVRPVWLAILGVSWFWAVGAIVLSLVPAFARSALRGDETVATAILALFSIGIAVGSLVCSRVMGAQISARLAPAAALALGLSLVGLGGLAVLAAPASGFATGLAVFATPFGLATLAFLLTAAISAGFFAVPLYAIIQTAGETDAVARAIAVNNVVNALMMVAASLATAVLASIGASPAAIILATGVATLAAAAWIARARRNGLP